MGAAIQGGYASLAANGQPVTFRDLCAKIVTVDASTRAEPTESHRDIYVQALMRQTDLTRRMHAGGYL